MDEDQLKIGDGWDAVKLKLQHKYANLTDDDLAYSVGKEDKLLGALQRKTGVPRRDLIDEIRGYSKTRLAGKK